MVLVMWSIMNDLYEEVIELEHPPLASAEMKAGELQRYLFGIDLGLQEKNFTVTFLTGFRLVFFSKLNASIIGSQRHSSLPFLLYISCHTGTRQEARVHLCASN